MAGVMDFVGDLTRYAAEKNLNTAGMTMKILGLPGDQREAITKRIEANPKEAADKVKKYLESDPKIPLQQKLDSLVTNPNFVQEFTRVLNESAPTPQAPPAARGQRMSDNSDARVFTGTAPLGRNADFIVRTGGMTATAAEAAPLSPQPERSQTTVAEDVKAAPAAVQSYADWAASLPPVDASGRPVTRMTIPDEKSILHTAPGFRDTVHSRFDGKDDNRASVILHDHAAAENKDSTLYSFMKELESRALGGTGETAASRFASHLNKEMASYSGGNLQKLAFEVSGMRADETGRPLRVETGTENGHAVYGPGQSGGVAATKEILNILDKYPSLGDGAIQNAFAGSRGAGGVVDPSRLAEGLRAKAWGEELAAKGFEGVDPVLAQQIRIDRMVDGATAADGVSRPGVAAALHRDAFEHAGDQNSFTGFLENLRQMPDNKTALGVAAGLYDRLKKPEDVERFTKGFNSVRQNAKTNEPDRLANGALKTVAGNPDGGDAYARKLVDYIDDRAGHFSKTPSPAQTAVPAPVTKPGELSPEMKQFSAKVKEAMGIDPETMAEASAGIDAFALKLQPYAQKNLEEELKKDPDFLNKKMKAAQEQPGGPFNKYFNDNIKGNPDAIKQAVSFLNDSLDKNPEMIPQMLTGKSPAPSSSVPSNNNAIAPVAGQLKQALGVPDDQQLKTSRDIDGFVERAMKDPELMNSFIQIQTMKPVKGADGQDVNPAMDRMKKELEKNPDLFEEMNKVIDRNPRVARSVFNQIAHGKIDEGVAQFTQTASMNGFVDMIAGFLDMIKPGLGGQLAGWIDGLRNRNPMLDSIASKIGGNLLPGDKKPDGQDQKTAKQKENDELEAELKNRELKDKLGMKPEKAGPTTPPESTPTPTATTVSPIRGEIIKRIELIGEEADGSSSPAIPTAYAGGENTTPPPDALGSKIKVGAGTTASSIFAQSASGEAPPPETPAVRRDPSLEAAEREAARRAPLPQNI